MQKKAGTQSDAIYIYAEGCYISVCNVKSNITAQDSREADTRRSMKRALGDEIGELTVQGLSQENVYIELERNLSTQKRNTY